MVVVVRERIVYLRVIQVRVHRYNLIDALTHAMPARDEANADTCACNRGFTANYAGPDLYVWVNCSRRTLLMDHSSSYSIIPRLTAWLNYTASVES